MGMILKSRFGATEPPSSKRSLAPLNRCTTSEILRIPPFDPCFCFLQNVSLWNTSHTGNLNGVQTQPACSSGKDEPPPRKRMLYPLLCSISWGYLAGWFVV